MDRIFKGPMIIRSGRHPFAIWICIGMIGISLYSIFIEPASGAIDEALHFWQRILWALQMLLGSSIVLYGLYNKDAIHGFRLERIGLAGICSGAICYVVVLCTVSTFARSGFIVTVGCAVAIGSIHRIWQITKDLKVPCSKVRGSDDDVG